MTPTSSSMDNLRANYSDEEDDNNVMDTDPQQPTTVDNSSAAEILSNAGPLPLPEIAIKEEGNASEDFSDDDVSEDIENTQYQSDQIASRSSPNFTRASETEDDEEEEDEESPPKKQKRLSSLTSLSSKVPQNGEFTKMASLNSTAGTLATAENSSQTPSRPPVPKSGSKSSKKSKKKNTNVWTRPTSRKGKKKSKINGNGNGSNANKETESADKVLITPVLRFPDKNDDSPDMKICLSKVYKAEKVEVSEDRLTAGSVKGYRMVRATRGVVEGPWYFEVKVVHLGETGHTRLGWSTDKGDLQAPVGYDGNSFGYRDIDGSKVHKALREKYGEEGYKQGDVIGFYINLPEGNLYAPNPPSLVWFKGQRYVSAPDAKEDPPKVIPGSEIAFFKNGICQGTAFKDLFGGRYFPAASMYTLPNQPNCTVKFNFGPDFECFPEDFGGRLIPRPMIEVPYHGLDVRVENGNAWHSTRMCPMLNVVREQGTKTVDAAEMAS